MNNFIILDYTKHSKNTLYKYGNYKIVSCFIYRFQLHEQTINLINFLSMNNFKKNVDYSIFYHLGLYLVVKNGLNYKNIIVEKNDVINIQETDKTIQDYTIDNNYLSIEMKRSLTLLDLMQETKQIMGLHKFYTFQSFNNNCQIFTKNMLIVLLCWNDINIKRFVLQDITYIINKIPKISNKMIDSITDWSYILHRIWGYNILIKTLKKLKYIVKN